MNSEKTSLSSKFWETTSALLIVSVVFSFITYVVRTIMTHQEVIAKIKNEK